MIRMLDGGWLERWGRGVHGGLFRSRRLVLLGSRLGLGRRRKMVRGVEVTKEGLGWWMIGGMMVWR